MFLYLLFFSILTMLGQIISMVSSSWLIVWVGMELSLLAVLPMMAGKLKVTTLSSEVTMKYFIVQSISSMWVMVGGYMLWEGNMMIEVSYVIFLLGMLLKLGLFPGHFWVIQVVSGLKKMSVTYVLGILKIAPILLLYQGLIFLSGYNQMIVFLGLMSVLVGSVLGMTQTTLRGVLGSSSISHGGWMVVSLSVFIVEFYLISYLITFMIFMLTWLTINSIESISIPIISFSGLPPFLLFLPKLMVIFQLMITSNFFSIFLLIIGSLLSLYFYLKMSYSFFLMKHTASSLKSMSFSGLISLIPVFFYMLFM